MIACNVLHWFGGSKVCKLSELYFSQYDNEIGIKKLSTNLRPLKSLHVPWTPRPLHTCTAAPPFPVSCTPLLCNGSDRSCTREDGKQPPARASLDGRRWQGPSTASCIGALRSHPNSRLAVHELKLMEWNVPVLRKEASKTGTLNVTYAP